jgi:hypothetical protein
MFSLLFYIGSGLRVTASSFFNICPISGLAMNDLETTP